MKSNFKLILCDLQADLCKEFETHFAHYPNVSVHNGDFMRLKFDCIVSAANSFGLMDGGVDGAITMYFGNQLQERVQKRIIDEYYGEQPVGTSFIIQGKEMRNLDGGNQYVAHTPTMRVPKDITATENVYNAMKAMLAAVDRHNIDFENGELPEGHNRIETVVCTGLGTFCGKMPFNRAAAEMRLAYYNFSHPPASIDWTYANQVNNMVFLTKMGNG